MAGSPALLSASPSRKRRAFLPDRSPQSAKRANAAMEVLPSVLKELHPALLLTEERLNSIPSELKCPITSNVMLDPVVLASGITYERMAIMKWRAHGQLECPVTKNPCAQQPVPNLLAKQSLETTVLKELHAQIVADTENAARGDVAAMVRLGRALEHKGSEKEAMKLYALAALKGSARASFEYGMGLLRAGDAVKGAQSLEEASSMGVPEAGFMCGVLHLGRRMCRQSAACTNTLTVT
jgi:hypothetical protein